VGAPQFVKLIYAAPLREKGLGLSLVKEFGLSLDEFAKLQKAAVTLRNNPMKAAQADA
jgi:hypothetical protein